MKTKFVEATNQNQNWGKFLLMAWEPQDFRYKSAVDPDYSLLRARGDHERALWVMDLETGEGARFYPSRHGLAASDLNKHRVWVCPLFEPFLNWLYANGINGESDLSEIPDLVQLPDAEADFRGYRRSGPVKALWEAAEALLSRFDDLFDPIRIESLPVVQDMRKAIDEVKVGLEGSQI